MIPSSRSVLRCCICLRSVALPRGWISSRAPLRLSDGGDGRLGRRRRPLSDEDADGGRDELREGPSGLEMPSEEAARDVVEVSEIDFERGNGSATGQQSGGAVSSRSPLSRYSKRPSILRIGNFTKTWSRGQYVPPYSLEPRNIQGVKRNYVLRELRGPRRRDAHLSDPFTALGINVRKETGNVGLIKPFLGVTGRIKSRAETGLSRKSQARLRKAVLKARAFGLTPYFSNAGAPTDAWDEHRVQHWLKRAKGGTGPGE